MEVTASTYALFSQS